jgi:hypothetical protein
MLLVTQVFYGQCKHCYIQHGGVFSLTPQEGNPVRSKAVAKKAKKATGANKLSIILRADRKCTDEDEST